MSSFDEGYKFGKGIMLAAAEADSIEAEVDYELANEKDREYEYKILKKRRESLKRITESFMQE